MPSSLRTPTTMHLPDPRQEMFYRFDRNDPSGVRMRSVNDHYADALEFQLTNDIPEDIRRQWDVALNLYLYAWNVYEFCMPAQMHAYATLELALRTRLATDIEAMPKAQKPRGLRNLLELAIHLGLIHDKGIERVRYFEAQRAERNRTYREFGWEISEDSTPSESYISRLATIIPILRNDSAHGSTSLDPSMSLTFGNIRDILQMLYAA